MKKRTVVTTGAALAVFGVGAIVGASASSTPAASAPAPSPTVTVPVPGPTVTVTASPAVTVTHTAQPVAAQVPQSPTLYSQSGQGQYTGPAFTIDGPVDITYTYNCSAIGTGNFIADLQTTNWNSDPVNGDDQMFANALGASGGKAVTVYPAQSGSKYYVDVNSDCAWTVKVAIAN